MKEHIKQLLALQAQDVEIDRIQGDIAAVPGKVAALKAEITALKTALEAAKKDLTQFQLTKKQKDLDLDTKEGSVRKYAGDLNQVKTNEAYRALLGEIEKAKQEKSALEDEILQLMEQIDQANKDWKAKEAAFKNQEGGLLKQISDTEAQGKALEQDLTGKQEARATALGTLEPATGREYERLHKNRKGAVAVPIRKGQCGGCHMAVSQNLMNEVRRGQKLMFCESCSRIVYLEEDAAAPAA